MIIHNTTYLVPNDDARSFVVWAHEILLPRAAAPDFSFHGRLSRILSHKEEDSECFSVQIEAPSTADIHRWFVGPGRALGTELERMFGGRVAGFGTLMEVIDGE